MMRGKPKFAIKKSLVRNAEVPVPPKLTSTTNKNEAGTNETRNKSDQTSRNQLREMVSLEQPALNSALLIVKEMKQTSEMKPLRVQNPPDFTEKVTQKMNVPNDEHLYHNLVALSVSDVILSENVSNVKVKPHKQDPSPDLADFHTPRCMSDIPAVVTHNFPQHTHAPSWDGRKVYLSTEEVKHDCYD